MDPDSTVTEVELLERRKCYSPSELQCSHGMFPLQPAGSEEGGGWPTFIGIDLSQYQLGSTRECAKSMGYGSGIVRLG